MRKKFIAGMLILNVSGAVSCIGLCGKFVVMPYLAERQYKEQYKGLMFGCDYSMREHLIAKNRFRLQPSTASEQQLESAEVGLTACHDYDRLRKKMLSMGLSSDELARFGLEAIEEKASDVQAFVRDHEFRY
jgi:hypothetical protein